MVHDDQVSFSVADSGIGISLADQDRIFQDYGQIDGPIQRRVRGTGLGLPLTRKLATLLGGTVSVTSAAGCGSTFTVTIPLDYDRARGASGDTAASSETPSVTPTRRVAHVLPTRRMTVPRAVTPGAGVPVYRANEDGDVRLAADDQDQPAVLVVDDTEGNRYAVARALRGAGMRVTEAATGADALRLAAALPDLIVLDINLPDMTGYKVAHMVKHDPATSYIPVMHVSASFTGSADRAFGLESGADAYLTHPIDIDVLVATARALLRVGRARAAASAGG